MEILLFPLGAPWRKRGGEAMRQTHGDTSLSSANPRMWRGRGAPVLCLWARTLGRDFLAVSPWLPHAATTHSENETWRVSRREGLS